MENTKFGFAFASLQLLFEAELKNNYYYLLVYSNLLANEHLTLKKGPKDRNGSFCKVINIQFTDLSKSGDSVIHSESNKLQSTYLTRE